MGRTPTSNSGEGIAPAVQALKAVAAGDRERGRILAARSADQGSLLGSALSKYLTDGEGGDVYGAPAAFESFIAGGGNVALYDAVSTALSAIYRRKEPLTVLDIGCGNGRALVPAVTATKIKPAIDLVDPSGDMLNTCASRLTELGFEVAGWNMDLRTFLDRAGTRASWRLVQSTFALQSISPGEREAALRQLAPFVDELIVVKFDVPDLIPGSDIHLLSLATRYERGLAEYSDDRELVAQGFLMPVLLGQLTAGTIRTNWEQPAERWVADLARAGFTEVRAEHLLDYWSSPAFILTAKGLARRL